MTFAGRDEAFGPGAFVLGLAGLIASVAWLWWGVLFLVAPLLTTLAVVLGDTHRRRDPPVAGRRLAIAGLVLGVAGLVVWVLWLVVFVWLAGSSGVGF